MKRLFAAGAIAIAAQATADPIPSWNPPMLIEPVAMLDGVTLTWDQKRLERVQSWIVIEWTPERGERLVGIVWKFITRNPFDPLTHPSVTVDRPPGLVAYWVRARNGIGLLSDESDALVFPPADTTITIQRSKDLAGWRTMQRFRVRSDRARAFYRMTIEQDRVAETPEAPQEPPPDP